MNRRREWLVLGCVACVALLLQALWVREWGPQVSPVLDVRAPGAGLDENGWRMRVEQIVQADHVTGFLGGEPERVDARAGFVYVLAQIRVDSDAGADACLPALRTTDGVLVTQRVNLVVPLFDCAATNSLDWVLYEIPADRAGTVVGIDVEPRGDGRHIVLRPPS